jgi:hypothetical protein
MARLWKKNRRKYQNLSETVQSDYRPPLVNVSVGVNTTLSVDNYLRPIVRELTQDSIQTFIKQRITRSQIEKFLENKMTELNIGAYAKLFESSIYTYTSPENKKYFFDLIMALLYEEILSFEEISLIIAANTTIDAALLIFEKIVVLEYELYTLDESIEEDVASYKKVYITDNLPIVYYGNNLMSSYKDVQNLTAELTRIFNDSLASQGLLSLPTVLTGFSPASLIRVNNQDAIVEVGPNISKYSFLLNYNSTSELFDKRLLKQYYGIQSGYYKKDGETISLSGISGYSYYPLLSDEYTEDYRKANLFLKDFWDAIRQRTINY